MDLDLDTSVPLIIDKFEKIDPDDLFQMGDAFLDEFKLNGHHIRSANNFYSKGINQIITEGFDIRKIINNKRSGNAEDQSIERIECSVKFTDVMINRPVTLNFTTGTEGPLQPRSASLRDKIYSGPLYVSFDVEAIAYLKSGETIRRTDSSKNFRIAKIPIIKGSILCNTYDQTAESLMRMGEDPSDPGGYFITKNEYAIDSTESTTFNQLKIYINEGYAKSRVRGDFISKPGDGWQNQDMCILIFNTDDTFTIEVSRDRLMDVKIPFYILFRAMGWSTDKELFSWIVYDPSTLSNQMVSIMLTNAMKAKYHNKKYQHIYDQYNALKEIVDLIPEEVYKYLDLKNNPENYQIAINDVLNTIDTHFLTHIGMTSDYRVDKMRYLALMVRKVLMTYLGYIPQTDRDSYRNKRIHAAGDNIAKAFKQIFNQSAAMPIKKHMSKTFNNTSFSQVNLVNMIKSAIYLEDFERLITQTIVAGNKTSLKIRQKTITNRLMAQLLHRKNNLNMWATMRQVSSTSADSAKQSERAAEMRRVHMSALGYICPAHSPPEGEKVGINKQIAIFASIAPASSSEVLKRIVLEDKYIIPESELTPIEIYRGNYVPVYVNGHLIAYTKDGIKMVNDYRLRRRRLEINPFTTISWDNTQNEVLFFVDIGRMVRPLTIVYNNKRDPEVSLNKSSTTSTASTLNTTNTTSTLNTKTGGDIDDSSQETESFTNPIDKKVPFEKYKFHQGIAITQQDILDLYAKKKGIYDLVKEQKVEFITPEEQQNIYICHSLKQLYDDEYDEKKEYTHVDIPQAIMGITALTAPFANHNQAPRVTYQTSQSKQTCGYYVGNWPFRIDKEAFLQYINEMPLIKTAVNKYVFPNGNNIMVAMACYTGTNQEDSVLFNQASVDRGVFNGCKLDFTKAEIEQKETLDQPDATKTEGIKSGNYSKMIHGVIPPGTPIEKDDFIIGKYMNIPKKQNSKSTYMDTSVIYKDSEPAQVLNVVIDRNEDGMRFAKVGYKKTRPLAVGDKMCLLPSAKVMTHFDWVKISDIESHLTDLNYIKKNPAWFNNPEYLEFLNSKEQYKIITTDTINNYPTDYSKYIVSDYDSEIDGELFEFRNPDNVVISCTTPNHKNYIYLSTDYDEYLANLPLFRNKNQEIMYMSRYPFVPNFRFIASKDIPIGSFPIFKSDHLTSESKLNINYAEPFYEKDVVCIRITKIAYKGPVYCFEIPKTHIFYYRESMYSPPIWTGNSSRAGQKGICASLMDEANMPFTSTGIRPDLIFNPHGIPSRMTCSQLIESLVGNVCAIKGAFYDGTIFKSVDIESFAAELEQYGFNRYGYERMISGITGEYIDTMVFFGPTFYQRLQKFVADQEYSVRHALTDAITHQPLDGMASAGGLRLGEMERDALASHGVSMFIREKFFNHSDGYTDFICGCGRPAITNIKEKIFKCKSCKDNMNAIAVPTSWTSKLFIQEMSACNVGILRIPQPFQYSIDDDEKGTMTQFEEYNEETYKAINRIAEDLVDDGAALDNE